MLRATIVFLIISVGALNAQTDPITSAKRASQMLIKASDALQAAGGSSDRVAALTGTIRGYEEGLAAMREGLRRVVARERVIKQSFEAESDTVAQLLGVLMTIGTSPAPILMLHPSGPLGAARSGMIVSDVTPALAREAQRLRLQLEELSVLRLLQEDATAILETALAEVQTARVALAKAIADRDDLPRRFIADADQLAAMIQNSDTLASFADNLERLDDAGDLDPATLDSLKGTLELPAPGLLLHGFNDPDAAGIERPGLVLATMAQSLVSAPLTGTIRYAGPLLNYGQVVILEPGAGVLIIFEGLQTTLAEAGEIVETGAPIGLMGGNTQTSDAFLMKARKGSGGNRQESLYIEVREGGTPVDPTAWFDMNRE